MDEDGTPSLNASQHALAGETSDDELHPVGGVATGGSAGIVDLGEVGRRLMAQMDHRMDSELLRIRQECSSAIGFLTNNVQNQLKQSRKHMIQLSESRRDTLAHTARIVLQVMAMGHTADIRHVKTTKAQLDIAAQTWSACSPQQARPARCR